MRTSKPIGFGKRKWGDKLRLDYRVVNIIQSKVDAGTVPPEILEDIFRTYQTD